MRALLSVVAAWVVALDVTMSSAATRVSTELISDSAAISPGATIRVGVLFKIPPHSHIYWSNPGESGLPTEIQWTHPPGFTVENSLWPMPVALVDSVLKETTFAYEREVLISGILRAPATLTSGTPVTLGAKLSWLVCLENSECVPEKNILQLVLPVAEKAAPSPKAALFDDYASRVPRAPAKAAVPVIITFGEPGARGVRAQVSAPWTLDLAAAQYFPDSGGPWSVEAPKDLAARDSEIMLVPAGKIDGLIDGALRLSVKNQQTGEVRALYLRVDEPPTH